MAFDKDALELARKIFLYCKTAETPGNQKNREREIMGDFENLVKARVGGANTPALRKKVLFELIEALSFVTTEDNGVSVIH